MLNLNSYWLLKTTTSHDFILWSCDSWIVAFPVTRSLARTYASNLLTLYVKLSNGMLRGQILTVRKYQKSPYSLHFTVRTSTFIIKERVALNSCELFLYWSLSGDIIKWLNQWMPTGLNHINSCNHFQKYGQVSLIKNRKDLIPTLWPILTNRFLVQEQVFTQRLHATVALQLLKLFLAYNIYKKQ